MRLRRSCQVIVTLGFAYWRYLSSKRHCFLALRYLRDAAATRHQSDDATKMPPLIRTGLHDGRRRRIRWICLVTLTAAFSTSADADRYQRLRLGMLDAIRADYQETAVYIDKNQADPRVLAAMGRVPRHQFVPDKLQDVAYENRPLPIGHGQTISQPYIVAVMTDLLGVQSDDRVLEVGTGSGYQAAVLAELVAHMYSIEIVEPLAIQANKRLQRLGYANVAIRHGDGYYGWEQHAPFDAIIVTAAASHIPPPLIAQLKPGGRMVIPVGTRFLVQELLMVVKDSDGAVTTRQLLPVRFVPLTGGH